MLAIAYWISFALLLITKAAYVWSTLRFVLPVAETNPFASKLFHRFGFKCGLATVSAIFLISASTQYILVWLFCTPLVRVANIALGGIIAWIQWDVARFNKTGKHSGTTLIALRCYNRWAQRWK